jgi:translocation and assembly module TamA
MPATIAAALLLASCATTKNKDAASAEDDARPEREVKAVEITGNARVEDGDLTDGLANHPPRGIFPFRDVAVLEPLALELDKQRIESAYKERGFFSAKVVHVKVSSISKEEVSINFTVDEGSPSTLDHVEVEGAPSGAAVNADALIETAKLEVGEAFEYNEYQRAKERIKARLLNQGYAHAQVDGRVEVDPGKQTAIARFKVDPGPVTYFGRVRVEGLERTDPSLVTSRVAWEPGERFDPLKLEATRGRLYDTGLVGNVRFDWPTEDRPRVLDVVIRADEGTRHELRLGGGLGLGQAHYEARARAMYSHRNFFDAKSTLRLNLRPGIAIFRSGGGFAGLNIEAGAEIDREDFLAPRWKLTTSADYTRTELEAFSFQGPSTRVSIGRPVLDERLVLSFAAQYHYYAFPRIDDAIPMERRIAVGLVEPLSFAAFQPSLSFDGRDDPFSPSRGWFAQLRFEAGHRFGEQTSNYLKISPELRGYVPIRGKRVVLAGKVRYGTTLLDLGPLPITQRYFGGGAESQRGFGYRRLSPQVEVSEDKRLPLGGAVLVETSTELRVDITKLWDQWLGIVLFIDGADVADELGDIKFPNLHWAAGPGLRYDTPVGPVRVDVGFRLNRTGGDEPDPNDRFALQFSLGEAF